MQESGFIMNNYYIQVDKIELCTYATLANHVHNENLSQVRCILHGNFSQCFVTIYYDNYFLFETVKYKIPDEYGIVSRNMANNIMKKLSERIYYEICTSFDSIVKFIEENKNAND